MWFRRASGMLAKGFVVLVLIWGLPGLVPGGSGAARAQSDSDIFTVRDVAVDETAATAAEARQVALSVGQRRAFRKLIDRLVPQDQQELVPALEAAVLQYYVRDFSVANERTSAVRYLADVTFRFNADEVRRLLRGSDVGFAETRGRPVVVLPVFRAADGEGVLWFDPNPWREIWAVRPSDDGLVPMVVPLGDLSDIAAIDAARALQQDPEALRSIAALYGTEDVLVAEAALTGDPAIGTAVLEVVSRRFQDGAPSITLRDKLIQVDGEPYDGFLARAAERIDSAVQEAWKQQNVLQFGNQRSILVFVPLEGLDDWLNIRRRLHGVAAIQESDLALLTRAEAQLELTFVGDEQRLTRALEQRDLYLSLREDSNWELGLAEKRNFLTPAPSEAPAGDPVFPAPAQQ